MELNFYVTFFSYFLLTFKFMRDKCNMSFLDKSDKIFAS